MESREVQRVIDDATAGKAGVEELDRLASDLSADDLAKVLDLVRGRIADVDEPDQAAALSRTVSSLLLRFAVRSDEPFAGRLALVAADLLRLDLADETAANNAGMIASILERDPAGMADVYDRIGEDLKEETGLKLLKAITCLGDTKETGRFAARLDQLEPAKEEEEEEAARAELEEARRILDSGEGAKDEVLKKLEMFLDGNPAHPEGLRLISRVLIETKRAKKVESWYVRALGSIDDDSSRVALLSDLGFIHLDPLKDAEKALGSFEAVLEVDRTHEVALTGYLQAMRTLDRLEEAVPMLEKLGRETAGQATEAQVLPVLAQAYQRQGKLDEAERIWRRLRAVDPRNAAALRFYEEFHETREDFQKLFTTLQFALSVVDTPDEKIRINRKMADVAENQLHNLERALDAYKRVLTLEPHEQDSRDAVVTLYEKTSKWHALVEFYNEQLRRLPADSVDEKVSVLFRIIEIYQDPDKFPNEDNVLANYARVVEISPAHGEALEILAKGYESRERWPDLLRVLQKKVAVTDNPEELLDLFHQIAEVAITRMSNETQAIPFLERILELDPQNLDVVKKLKSIYQRKHNQEKLFSMYLKELEMQKGPEREDVLASAAAMARDRLLRYEEALGLYEELYQLNPQSEDARENMHMLYTRLERWNDYVRFLADEVERDMPKKRRTEIRHKLGEVLLDRMGDANAARKVYETILKEDPKDDQAARRLEQVFLEQEDLAALRTVFLGRNDVRSYVALLVQRESREQDIARKVTLNLSIAEACDQDLGEPARAARYLEKAWALDKTLVDVGGRLLAIHESQGNFEGTVNLLVDLAPSLEDPSERLEAWTSLHRDLDKLGKSQEAFKAGVEAVRLALNMGDARENLDAVRKTAEKGSFWQEFAGLLDEVSTATMDHERRVDLLLELGTVYKNRLLFHDEARDVLDRVLDLDTGSLEALGMLEDIALQREDYVGLESVLRRRIDVASDPEQVRDIQMRLGRLYEDLLGDDAQAADCYMQVLQSNPDDREVLGGLHRTYERAEKFMELADVIRMEINADISRDEGVRLRCELARVCWENLDDFEEALRLLSAVLDKDLGASDAMDQLKELFDKRLARDEAANVMAPFFRMHERFDELEGLLKSRLEDMTRPEAKAAILMEIADIQGRIRGDGNAGFDTVAEAIGLHPADGYVERILELAGETGRYRDAAVALGQWVGILPDGVTASAATLPDAGTEARLSLKLGRLYAENLDEPRLAINAFEKALPFEEEDGEFLRELVILYRKVEDMDAVMTTYDRLADSLSMTDQRREVMLEKASVARETGLTEQAVETLRAVLDMGEGDAQASSELEELLAETSQWEELVRLLERREQMAGDPAERAEALLRIAVVQRDQLARPDLAAELLRRSLTEDPDSEEARLAAEALIRDPASENHQMFAPQLVTILEQILREEEGAEDRMVAVLGIKAELATSAWDRAVAYSDVATIETNRGNPAAAFDAMSLSFEAMPEDQGLLERTVESGRAAGKVEPLVDTLEAAAGKVSVDAGASILLAVAGLCRDDLKDPERARGLYDRLLELQPGSMDVLRELDTLLHEMGQEAERIPLLEDMAANARSVEEKRTTQVKIGELSHSTGDLEGAVRAYRFVLDRRPSEGGLDELATQASDRLLGLYDTLGRTRQVVDLRLLIGRVADDPVSTREQLLTAGMLTHDDLKDLDAAADIFDELLEKEPTDAAVLDWAKKTARERDDVDRLEALIGDELKLVEDDEDRVASLMELAGVHADHGDERALKSLRTVLDMDPTHGGAREMAVGFLDSDSLAVDAALVLEAAAISSDDDELLARVLEILVSRSDVQEDRTVLRSRLAECYSRLERNEDAVRVLSEAYKETPDSEDAFARLVESLDKAERMAALASLATEGAANAAGMESRLDVRLKAAEALVQAGLSDDAAGLLKDNRDDDPGHVPTLELMVAVNTNLERQDAVLDALDGIAEATNEEEGRAEVYMRCARLAEKELEDAEKSKGYYRKVLELFPLHDEAIPALAAILEGDSDSAGIRELRRNELSHLEGRDSVGDLLRIADLRRLLALDALAEGDNEEAVDLSLSLLQARQPEPDDLVTARRVYSETDYPPELFAALVDACERMVERDSLLDLYRFVSGLDLEDPNRESALRSAIELDGVLEKDDWLLEDLGSLMVITPEDAALRDRLESMGRRMDALETVKDRLVEAFGRHQDEDVVFDLASTIARLLRDDLVRDDEAVEYLRVAFLRKPEDRETMEALESLYEGLSRFGDLALLYENLGDMEGDGAKRIALYFKSFEVIRNQVKDTVSSAEILKKILDEDPTNGTALDALESIARETNDPTTLAQSLSSKAEVASSTGDRVALLQELAEVQSGPLADPAAAIETLNDVLAADPACEKARDALLELFVRTSKYRELADLYEQKAELAAGHDEKADALKKASAVYETHLEDRPMAVTLLLRVLELDPHSTYAFTRLTELLEEEQDYNALAELLKSQLNRTEAVSEKVDLNVRIGRVLLDKQEDYTGAVTHFKAALALDLYRDDAREGLETLLKKASVAMESALALESVYEASGEHMKLCDVLRRELDLVENASERETLLLRIAEVQVERLDDGVGGLDTLGEALGENLANADTLATMEKLAEESRQFEKLYGIIDARVGDARDGDVRSLLHGKAAELADHRLKSQEKASGHYAAFLKDNPGHADTLAALDCIYTDLGRSEELSDILRQRIGQGGEATHLDLRRRLAELMAGRLNDAEGALEQLRQVLELNPGDKEAIRQLSSLTEHPVSGRIALDLLTSSLRESDDDEGLLWALESQIGESQEGTDQAALLGEAAAASGRLGKNELEVKYLGKALALAPSDETLLGRLLTVSRESGTEAEAYGHLSVAADNATWEDLEKSLKMQAAVMARQAGGLEDEMEACLKRVLEIDPMYRDALDLLDDHYEQNGRAGDLVAVLGDKLKLDMSQGDRTATLIRMADLHLIRREVDRAAEDLEEASSIEPTDADILRKLGEVYGEGNDIAGKVSAIEKLSAVSSDTDERVRCLLEAARLQSDKLDDKVAARSTLEVLFGVDPTNAVGRGRLEELYEELGDWEPLMGMLSQVADGEGDMEQRLEASLKAASVAETHMDNLPAAISYLTKAADIAPENMQVIDESIRILYRLEDWSGLVTSLRTKAALVTTEPDQVALLAKACDVAQSKMGDTELAGTVAREVLAIDESNAKALIVTAVLMEDKEEYEEALDLFRRLSQSTGDMDERAQALLGVARILIARGDKSDEIKESLQAVARIKPDLPDVNRHLKELHLKGGDFESVIEIMQRDLKQAPDDVARAGICMDIAELYQEHLNDGAKYLEWAQDAHRFKKDDPRVVTGIVDFHLKSGEVRKAVPHLEWLVNFMEGKRKLKELPPYAHQLGKIMESAGDTDKAIQYYRLCHDHDAQNIANSLALGRLYLAREEHEKALRIYQPLVVRIDSLDASARVEVLLALASINASRGDKKKARQYVLRVLAEEPDNVEAQALLSKGL